MPRKHSYSTLKNLIYLCVNLWKKDRLFFLWGVLRGISFVIGPLLAILLQKVVLDGIFMQWSFGDILKPVLILVVSTVFIAILNHCATVGMAHHQGLNRMRFLIEMEKVFLRCPYQKVEDSKTQIELDKVSDLLGTSAPRTGVNGMHNGMYEVFVSVLGILVFGFLVGKLHIFLLVLVAAGSLGISFVEKRSDYKEFQLRMQEAPWQKKQDYFQHKLSKSRVGKDIRAYGCQKWLHEKLLSVLKEKEKIQRKQIGKRFQKDAALLGIEIFQNGAAILWITLSCLNGQIAISDFFVYLTAIIQLSEYVGKVIKAVDMVRYANLDVSEIRTFLDMEKENIKQLKDTALSKQDAFEIRIEHVSFRYPGSEKWLFEDLNLIIKKGEKLALVGENGAGKTTLVKLLCGFYPVSKGRILFDGENISLMDKGWLYEKISAVFQDIVVLPFSVGQNVTLSEKNNFDESRIKKCLAQAGIAEKLPNLYAKMDKRVYESGIELSGGERQKLVFARAIYKQAGFLILDEPTAALDPVAESRLYQQYYEISKDKTTLFISHRLASTSFCDRIILLEQGKIVEDGTHKSLLKVNGRYAEMFRMQSQYYQKEVGKNG